MKIIKLEAEELKQHYVGEAVTIATVMTILLSAVMAVVIYQLFISKKGTATIPGGWKFTWN